MCVVDVTLSKIGLTDLKKTGLCKTSFGQYNEVLVKWKDQPKSIHKYQLNDKGKLTQMWKKPLPVGLKYDCWTHCTTGKRIIMSSLGKMYVFSDKLELTNKYDVPGEIYGVIGDYLFVLCNGRTPESEHSRQLRLSVRKLYSPRRDSWYLRFPKEGAYSRKDKLFACGSRSGDIVVIAREEPFVDFYNSDGE